MKFSNLENNKVYSFDYHSEWENENGEKRTENEKIFAYKEGDELKGVVFSYSAKGNMCGGDFITIDRDMFENECRNCVEVWNGDFEK